MSEVGGARSSEALKKVFQTFLDLPVHQLMGLELVEAGDGLAHARFNAADAALVPGGYVHGGVLSVVRMAQSN